MAEVVGVPESIEIELDELDINVPGVEVVEEKDPIEAELTQVADATKTKKAKKEKKEKEPKEKKGTNSPLTSVQPLADGEVGAAYVAELCGVDQRVLRAFLRKNYRNMDQDKSTRYKWPKDDPKIQEIVDAFKASKVAAKEPKKEEKIVEPVATEPEVELVDNVEIESLD